MGSDHAGLELKLKLKEFLQKQGCSVEDVGTHTQESCDYPDYAVAAGKRLTSGEFDFGVLVCGSGLGISIAANKVPGVRAVPITLEYLAEMSRRHNNANFVCLGARVVGIDLAEAIVKRFLETDYEGGRHQRRIDKIKALDA
jgi:ribose 5-phosphate isomerase B